MKKITQNVISGVLVVVASAFSFFTGFVTGETKSKMVQETAQVVKPVEEVDKEQEEPIDVVHDGGVYNFTNSISFMSDELAIASEISDSEGISIELIAEVLPIDAINKEVDWSLSWDTNSNSEWTSQNVNDFIVIEPIKDGSTTAIVTLKKYFHENAIVISVITRSKGFKADCYARCVSQPDHIVINYDGAIVGNDSYAREYYQLASTKTANFTYQIMNKFGYVHEGDVALRAYFILAYNRDVYKDGIYTSTSYSMTYATVDGLASSTDIDNENDQLFDIGSSSTNRGVLTFNVVGIGGFVRRKYADDE